MTEEFMIAPVRKFDIEVNGKWLQVIYIIQEGDGNTIKYAAVAEDGTFQARVPIESITKFMVNE
jgi:hypothetical protein